jgi:S-sulfosulfanyl-L-cysteine sulfohydrolase
MITRRDLLAASVAASAALGGLPLAKAAARQALTEDALLAHETFGNLTILHVTDIHAQTKPTYFREPAINIGTGEARGLPPHLTQSAFLSYFGIEGGSPEAYALTSSDFESLAETYGKLGGLDRIATIVKAVRGERGEGNVLFLDGGDSWQGSWVSLQTKGQDMIDLMPLLKPDAMTGHWEFTYGAERMKAAAGALPYPFLAQNIRSAEWQEPVFEAQRSFERGGAKIAVIGQAFPYTPIANPRWMIPDWEFGIREDDLQREVNEARRRSADLVVLLSHSGFETDRKLASRIHGIDIILSGHTHDAMPQAIAVGSTILVASGCNGKFVARLDLDIRDKRLRGFRYKLIPVFADAIRSDPEMAAAIANSRAPFEKALGEVIGDTETLLFRRGNFNGSLDDLICNAMMAERDCEIAMSPGMRWGTSILPGGPIAFEDIANATSITYPACYRIEMTGARLKEAVEDIADNVFNPDPYYQQGGDMVRLGGVAYRIDVSAPAGKRISNMTLLRTGEPVEAAKSYAVAGWASVNKDVEGPPIWEVLRSYIGRTKTVRLKQNSAITVSGA